MSMEIKYAIKSRGSMLVEYGGKKLFVEGELIFTPPVFYANLNSIANWEPPYEDEGPTQIEKDEIIKFIKADSQREGSTKILFD